MSVTSPEQKPVSSAGVALDEDVRQYLQQIHKYPQLTPEQERLLAMACAEGDQDAIRTMVNSNLRLVVSVAREYAGRGVPLLDLIQEGSIGLLIATRKFDYTLEFRFSTYATKWIRQRISRCLINHAGLIRVPSHTAQRMRGLKQDQAALRLQLEREPTMAELADYSGVPEKKIKQLFELIPEVCSLDVPTGDGDDGTLALLLEDTAAPQPQEELVRRELKQNLETLLGMLTPRQQKILRLHFGMEDGVCYTLEQIGAQLGISKERARQVERQAISALQKMGTDIGLEDFLNE